MKMPKRLLVARGPMILGPKAKRSARQGRLRAEVNQCGTRLEISARVPQWVTTVFRLPWRADLFAFGPKMFGPLATSNLFGLVMFLLLAASLFYFARKKLD